MSVADNKQVAYHKNMSHSPSTSNYGSNSRQITIRRANIKTDMSKKYIEENKKRAIWKCRICNKSLSSKRSCTEHMNIHTNARPFKCESCDYAAASQMTLARHKLRNHTPKAEWSYHCPYCDDAYIEPAAYRQHIRHYHFGKSATYGCPFITCQFTSKSQRHFKEHLLKHKSTESVLEGVDPCMLTSKELIRYMINDDCGYGIMKRKLIVRPRKYQPIVASSLNPMIHTGDDSRNEPPRKMALIRLQPRQPEIVNIEEDRQPSKLQANTIEMSGPLIMESDDDYDDEPPVLMKQDESLYYESPDTNWVESEVEVTSNNPRFPNGFFEEELD